MNVTLDPRSETLVRDSVQRGDFGSPEEAVARAIECLLSEDPEELSEIRQAIEEAENEEGDRPAREFFADLRAKHGV